MSDHQIGRNLSYDLIVYLLAHQGVVAGVNYLLLGKRWLRPVAHLHSLRLYQLDAKEVLQNSTDERFRISYTYSHVINAKIYFRDI